MFGNMYIVVILIRRLLSNDAVNYVLVCMLGQSWMGFLKFWFWLIVMSFILLSHGQLLFCFFNQEHDPVTLLGGTVMWMGRLEI